MQGFGISERLAEPINGCLSAVHLLLDDLGALAIGRGKRGKVGEDLGVAEDGGEGIADFMRGTRSEAAEGGEFFRVRGLSLHGLEIFE